MENQKEMRIANDRNSGKQSVKKGSPGKNFLLERKFCSGVQPAGTIGTLCGHCGLLLKPFPAGESDSSAAESLFIRYKGKYLFFSFFQVFLNLKN